MFKMILWIRKLVVNLSKIKLCIAQLPVSFVCCHVFVLTDNKNHWILFKFGYKSVYLTTFKKLWKLLVYVLFVNRGSNHY